MRRIFCLSEPEFVEFKNLSNYLKVHITRNSGNS